MQCGAPAHLSSSSNCFQSVMQCKKKGAHVISDGSVTQNSEHTHLTHRHFMHTHFTQIFCTHTFHTHISHTFCTHTHFTCTYISHTPIHTCPRIHREHRVGMGRIHTAIRGRVTSSERRRVGMVILQFITFKLISGK